MKSIYSQKDSKFRLSAIRSIAVEVKLISVFKRILEIESVHTDCI